MQRTIEIADFELPRGAVTIHTLMAMDQAAWEHLRGEINFRRARQPDRPLARCRLCGGAVYIRAQTTRSGNVPMFAHYTDATAGDCPWYQGANLVPDNARAAQYQGHQECALHRWMCDTIANLLEQDPRCAKVTVDRYLKPAIEDRGRYPDVYAEIEGVGRFAFEVQLSKPFAFEIAARHQHYQAEGVSLIWVFRGLDAELPQGFRDVISFQRGNAFLFDEAAFNASIQAGGLTLSAWLEGANGWLKPRFARLDDLDRGTGRSVFLEDRRTPGLIEHCRAAREIWRPLLRTGAPFDFANPATLEKFAPAWASIRSHVPALSAWKDAYWYETEMRGVPHFLEIAAILFSIARTAIDGEDRVYVSRYNKEGALVAMLNARLSGFTFMPYAALFEAMLTGTRAHDYLERTSLRTALRKARGKVKQVGPEHAIWTAAARLFPEVYNGMLRAELADLRALPTWAAPGTAINREAA
ncbi:hypothetical protein OF829_12700 [Sphingomonas sp. LB-2]|uniref:DUF6035 family protein n=1 Tax=Sphingomonas caeni TaxID=2984949 RepID=UPI00222E80AE|nr:hypothetical protein [Sphingomonas caeni]MCW3848102.1 hypothetical protein [Sphingomonas caeni]